ncbi:MAG: peptidase C1 [Bacteroidetes bacterium]|nr:peptidase C1 [Bacteroidota bacterium]
MPIRMVEDNDNQNSNNNNPPERKKGGGGAGNIIGMLLPLLLRNPKLALIALVLGGGYFLFQKGCSSGAPDQQAQSSYATGCEMKREVYDSAEVFAALSDKEKLPDQVSLQRFCPTPQNQGQQGSCVGWGSAYAARTILQAVATGEDPNQIAFSPSFLYNQIGLEGCQGSYINRAMDNMKHTGAMPYRDFPYDENSCDKLPNSYELQDASKFKMKGYNRLTLNGDDFTVDMQAMKQNLAQGAPVVVGMSVGGTFMREMEGQESWMPSNEDYDKNGFGGHCMCVVGYDEFLNGGSFQLMNSWGTAWGNKGFAWVRYKDFEYFCNEAYGIYPLARTGAVANETRLNCSIGLIDKESGSYIALQNQTQNSFSTLRPLAKGTKFKVEVSNSIECYTYVFAQDTDKSSYVLFPYTPKHSAYCGITGTRIFPRDYSMLVDAIGAKDFMAIVVSKNPIDYKAINNAINNFQASTYVDKINGVLAAELIPAVGFTTNQKVNFECDTKSKNAVALVIAVDKR